MTDIQQFIQFIRELPPEQKEALRALLNEEGQEPLATKPTGNLVGLFEHDPGLIDKAVASSYEQRSTPFRAS